MTIEDKRAAAGFVSVAGVRPGEVVETESGHVCLVWKGERGEPWLTHLADGPTRAAGAETRVRVLKAKLVIEGEA